MNKSTAIFTLALLTPCIITTGESSSSSSSSYASSPNPQLKWVQDNYLNPLEKAQNMHTQASEQINADLAHIPDKGKKLLAALAVQQTSEKTIREAQPSLNAILEVFQTGLEARNEFIADYGQEILMHSRPNAELTHQQGRLEQEKAERDDLIATIAVIQEKLAQLTPQSSNAAPKKLETKQKEN